MIKVIKETKIYNFKELENKVQDKVINNFINMLVQFTDFEKLNKNTNLYKAYKKANELKTPWFLGQYIWEYDKKNILGMCKNYNYLENGEIYE